jgi:hypothetical protein
MKRVDHLIWYPLAAYTTTSYLLFPLFLLRYVDFPHRTLFGDMGFTIPELLGMILLSPCYVAYFGFYCLWAPLDGKGLHSVAYLSILVAVFFACWLAISRLTKRHEKA